MVTSSMYFGNTVYTACEGNLLKIQMRLNIIGICTNKQECYASSPY
jgi:hypothetical protein